MTWQRACTHLFAYCKKEENEVNEVMHTICEHTHTHDSLDRRFFHGNLHIFKKKKKKKNEKWLNAIVHMRFVCMCVPYSMSSVGITTVFLTELIHIFFYWMLVLTKNYSKSQRQCARKPIPLRWMQTVSRKERIHRSQLKLKIGFNSRRMFFVKPLFLWYIYIWFVKMVVIVKPIE